jgi:hypothetical protein
MKTRGGKQSSYPNISTFLEDNRPDVLALYKKSGIMSRLKGSSLGATFMLPDAKYTKELEKMLETTQGEITQWLSALVIPFCLDTEEKWDAYKADIPNKLRQKVEVVSVAKGKIKLKEGELTPSKFVSFKTFDGRAANKKYAVWNLKGKVPIDGKEAEYKFVDKYFKTLKEVKVKKGGFAQLQSNVNLYRALLNAVKETVNWAGQTPVGEGTVSASPLRTLVTRIVLWLQNNNQEEFNKWLCLASNNIAAEAFLLLDSPLFNADVIQQALNQSVVALPSVVSTYLSMLDNENEFIASKKQNMEIQNINNMAAEGVSAFKNKVAEIYESIYEKNELPGMAGQKFICGGIHKYIYTLDQFMITMAEDYKMLCAENVGHHQRIISANLMLYHNYIFCCEKGTPQPLSFEGDIDLTAAVQEIFLKNGRVLSFTYKNNNIFFGGDEEDEDRIEPLNQPMEKEQQFNYDLFVRSLNNEGKQKLQQALSDL